jgi:hypothetical protein
MRDDVSKERQKVQRQTLSVRRPGSSPPQPRTKAGCNDDGDADSACNCGHQLLAPIRHHGPPTVGKEMARSVRSDP